MATFGFSSKVRALRALSDARRVARGNDFYTIFLRKGERPATWQIVAYNDSDGYDTSMDSVIVDAIRAHF